MKLFNLNRKTFEVEFEEAALLLSPFAALFKRDKTKNKEVATNEMAYIYFFTDPKSDYQIELDDNIRTSEILKDLKLPKGWKPDKLVKEAIEFYRSRSRTATSAMYEAALAAAASVNKICLESDDLIQSADDPIAAAQKIMMILEKIPKAMANLSAAHKELIKEQQDAEGKTKGSKVFNTFEGMNLIED